MFEELYSKSIHVDEVIKRKLFAKDNNEERDIESLELPDLENRSPQEALIALTEEWKKLKSLLVLSELDRFHLRKENFSLLTKLVEGSRGGFDHFSELRTELVLKKLELDEFKHKRKLIMHKACQTGEIEETPREKPLSEMHSLRELDEKICSPVSLYSMFSDDTEHCLEYPTLHEGIKECFFIKEPKSPVTPSAVVSLIVPEDLKRLLKS